jgi:hypothetical protein
MRPWIALAALLAACATEPSEITVRTGRPFLAAIDRGDGWEVLPDQEELVLEVDGPFALASACGIVGFTVVDAWLATAEDGAEWTMPCRQDGGDFYDLEIGMATGTMGETRVATGDQSWLLEDDLPQRAELRAGASDRLAVEQEGEYRFVLERAVALDGPGEWVIDLDRDGRARVPIEITTDLAPEESEGRLATPVRIWTDGVFLELPDLDPDPATARVLPADVLVETDVQRIYAIHDPSATQRTWTSDRVGAGRFDAVLPALVDEFGFTLASGIPVVTFVDDRRWPDRRLHAQTRPVGGAPRYWNLTALPGWVETAGEDGALAFPDVTTIPGWDPAWQLDAEYLGELHLTTDPGVEPVGGLRLTDVSSP